MDQQSHPNHSLFFALGAFVLLILLGSRADVGEMNAAAVGSAITGPTEKVLLPLHSALTGGEWQAVGTPDMVGAISEQVCDGNSTYIEPKFYAVTDATFSVSLQQIPDGAKITSLSVTPCLGSLGGSATSDIAITFSFPGETFMLQPVSGKGSPYILKPGSNQSPTVQKTSVFSLPSILKKSDSMLTVGVLPTRNGGGIRVSNIAVSAEYLPPGASEAAVQEPFSAKLDWSIDDAKLLYVDALLSWDESTGAQGGQIEAVRITENNDIVGAWSMVGVVSDAVDTLRYPIVIAGMPRDDYVSGLTYAFRIRKEGAGNLVEYSDTVKVAPPEHLRVEAPTAFVATLNTTAKRADLSWTDRTAGETNHKFLIDRAMLANVLDWKQVGQTSQHEVLWTDTGLHMPGNYFYRVRTARSLPEYEGALVVSQYSDIQGVLLSDQW